MKKEKHKTEKTEYNLLKIKLVKKASYKYNEYLFIKEVIYTIPENIYLMLDNSLFEIIKEE